MTINTEQAQRFIGGRNKVYDSSGDKIGTAEQIYLDETSGQPSWVTVNTGLFGTSESFVPLEGARIDGDDLVVQYDKARVKDAPRVDPDGHLSEAEEATLYDYYGVGGGTRTGGYDDVDRTRGTDTHGTDTHGTDAHGTDTRAGFTEGHDTSGPTTDDAMTRSEEQLHVGTERREAGRARLRKYVVTENVTQTVPVQREEVRVEREPITDANRGDALDGPAISEEEHEVVLHEERPVVDKEAVPVERVRLGTETVTDQQTISEEVRKEQIETAGVDDDTRHDGPTR
ncbi:PRC and DUF2382 domain-containing protein [Auraticoccus monumenti]|uniref:Conserved domain-containing protein n=1 Tax=Auraticoccus monumenti TaxID=675864 RepID=A0A1G6SXE1_9ACTN|nr:PRC and DUF2382 domain-containing protein [Auraticoccus monumenti]SDD21411.1 conserved domain-containing protein [Auraticoccus monumenti]